jgi:hypothetical protein
MKKLVMVGALVLSLVSFSGPAFSAGYGDAGCGLGAIVMGDRPGGPQVVAWFLNITGMASIAITTGTSQCNPVGLVKLEKEREEFAEKNYPSLVKEMAMGKGENLDTLAGLYGCPQDSRADFGSLVQENFRSIVKNDSTDSQEMLSSLNFEISEHAVLSKSCVGIIS